MMSQVPVKWAYKLMEQKPNSIYEDGMVLSPIPVVPLSALREVVNKLIRYDMVSMQKCGEAWQDLEPCIGGDWVQFEPIQRLLASLGEGKDVPEIGFGNRKEE